MVAERRAAKRTTKSIVSWVQLKWFDDFAKRTGGDGYGGTGPYIKFLGGGPGGGGGAGGTCANEAR